jgi:hypothetical protein
MGQHRDSPFMREDNFMSEIIILANSIKPGGHCIAGIDNRTGEWIRPISRENCAIPKHVAGKIKLLDIVKIPLATDRPKDRYQRENRFVDSLDWKVVSNVSPKYIRKYCEDCSIILHSHNDRVAPEVLDEMPFKEWKSLQLVRTDVNFERDSWKRNRWRASFNDGAGKNLSLKVDYPEIVAKLNDGKKIGSDCMLTISLAGPWAPPDGSMPEKCYKLVAGVIEL